MSCTGSQFFLERKRRRQLPFRTGLSKVGLPGAKQGLFDEMQVGDETYFVAGEVFYAPTQTGSEILFEVVESPFG